MDTLGMSPSVFADKIGIQRAIISHILSRRNKPSLDVIQKILSAFENISPKWMLTGIEPMQLDLFEDYSKKTTVSKAYKEKLEDPKLLVKEDRHEDESVYYTSKMLEEKSINPNISASMNPAAESKAQTPHNNVDLLNINPKKENLLSTDQTELRPPQKKINKIIFFYDDNTFSIQYPE
jgi:transcriptional regulator with XRE-family HTH domain